MKRARTHEASARSSSGPVSSHVVESPDQSISSPVHGHIVVTETLAKCFAILQQAAGQRRGFFLPELLQLAGVHANPPPELLHALHNSVKVDARADQKYYYKTRYDARDRFELTRLISSLGDSPLLVSDLIDLYPGAAADVDDLTRKGDIIRIRSIDRQLSDVVYSRDMVEASRVRLSGVLTVTAGSAIVRSTADVSSELFRNDVVIIQGQAFRVSSEPENYKRRAGGGAADDDEDDLPQPAPIAPAPGPVTQIAQMAALLKAMQAGAAPAAAAPAPTPAPDVGPLHTAGLGPPTGVYRVSIANAVKATGGMYSAGDTAPHVLRAPQTYAHPFTGGILVLDRLWPGPSASGQIGHKLGATGDLRVLWREVVTHGQVALTAGPAGIGAVASSIGAGDASLAVEDGYAASSSSEGSSLMLSLGGAKAFKSLPPFPVSHREVRSELRNMGIITKMLPGTLDVVPMAGALGGRSKRVRTLDKRVLNLTTAGHLSGATLEAVKAAQLEVVRKQLIAKQQEAAQAAARSAQTFGGPR